MNWGNTSNGTNETSYDKHTSGRTLAERQASHEQTFPSGRASPFLVSSSRCRSGTQVLRTRRPEAVSRALSERRTHPSTPPSTPLNPAGKEFVGILVQTLRGKGQHVEESSAVAGGREPNQRVQMIAPNARSIGTPTLEQERGKRRVQGADLHRTFTTCTCVHRINLHVRVSTEGPTGRATVDRAKA